MRIIPAIDIIDGKCVRLSQGDYDSKKVYNEDPVAVARGFADLGIRYLHVVDLDGAKARHIVNYKVLEKIAAATDLIIDFGGGIKTNGDIEIAFSSGAAQVTAGTIAVQDPDLFRTWLDRYGPERLILGADVRNGTIAINGWKESSTVALTDFLESYVAMGIKYVVCTDISKDGMLQGPALDLYREIRLQFPDLKLIASGGVSNLEDVHDLEAIGCDGAIIGKAIYEGKVEIGAMMASK